MDKASPSLPRSTYRLPVRHCCIRGFFYLESFVISWAEGTATKVLPVCYDYVMPSLSNYCHTGNYVSVHRI